jgi:hypothetical protein
LFVRVPRSEAAPLDSFIALSRRATGVHDLPLQHARRYHELVGADATKPAAVAAAWWSGTVGLDVVTYWDALVWRVAHPPMSCTPGSWARPGRGAR